MAAPARSTNARTQADSGADANLTRCYVVRIERTDRPHVTRRSLVKSRNRLTMIVAMFGLAIAACEGSNDAGVAVDEGPVTTTNTPSTTAAEPAQVTAPIAEQQEVVVDEPMVRVDDGNVFFDANTTGNFELYVRRPNGSVEQLTDDPTWDSWWVRPSPDRTEMVFYRTPAGTHDQDYSATALWRADADGKNARTLLAPGAHGWAQHGHAEWSPDGRRLTMFAGSRSSPQIWITDTDGQEPEAVTDDPGTNIDPSWSPDGATIVYVGCPRRICFPASHEIYVIPAAGGDRRRLTDDDLRDHDPYVAPDGEVVAFLTQTAGPTDGAPVGFWDIRLVPTDGGDTRALTPGDQVYSLPRFAPDGTIWTHRLRYGSNRAFDLVTIDAVNGEVTEVVATRSSEEYPAP